MKGLLVDSNVVLDVFLDDPEWADWSESTLAAYCARTALYINPIIYTEVSIGFKKIEEVESALHKGGFRMLEIPREALFLAGKAYLKYRKARGTRKAPLPDFYIGAQAAVLDLDLITRDAGRYRTYFPGIRIICPE
ncbi:type II toxin-antitoxin system VapC family toxin [Desulfosudis oleivorans]|uniref:PilT protein domain protein n=1 Tax=Desulfosudis oleivorans (strain DSM 6200 / JCM 39069 / Hxd3) TaxID=96561 RepID=A9A051_DESOH|nr:type II toxin-antitoxin system VapC family toxin [Desulfosudis oleivorans]ABW68970.1 PilT protein domain protein [Desulfosudis oleivorans Hxd3]